MDISISSSSILKWKPLYSIYVNVAPAHCPEWETFLTKFHKIAIALYACRCKILLLIFVTEWKINETKIAIKNF